MEAFKLNGYNYTCTRPGYFYKGMNGSHVRIKKEEYDEAHKMCMLEGFDLRAIAKEVTKGILSRGNEYRNPQEIKDYARDYGWDSDIDEFGPENISTRTDEEDEQLTKCIADLLIKALPKKSKTRRQIAYTTTSGETLTEKQVDFIKRLPKADYWENINSVLWVDCLADTMGGQFANKPMTIGAMVSTLNEKKIIEVSSERIDGKKARKLRLTEKGKEIARELGIK